MPGIVESLLSPAACPFDACAGLGCPAPEWEAYAKPDICECACRRAVRPPPMLHQAWKTRRVESMATPIAACVRSWREVNPWLRQHVFDDNRSALFVRRHYPQWASLYFDGLQRVVERMDVFRYLVVHHYGGWWADVDGARTSVPLCQAPAERRARLALLQRTPCAR